MHMKLLQIKQVKLHELGKPLKQQKVFSMYVFGHKRPTSLIMPNEF
jgi:hypothetical protein